MPILLLM